MEDARDDYKHGPSVQLQTNEVAIDSLRLFQVDFFHLPVVTQDHYIELLRTLQRQEKKVFNVLIYAYYFN